MADFSPDIFDRCYSQNSGFFMNAFQSRKLQGDSVAPANWHAFLRKAENRVEFFRFISK